MNILLIADFDMQGGTGTYFKRIVPFLKSKGNVHIVLQKHQYANVPKEFLNDKKLHFTTNLFRFYKVENILMRIFRRLKLVHIYT